MNIPLALGITALALWFLAGTIAIMLCALAWREQRKVEKIMDAIFEGKPSNVTEEVLFFLEPFDKTDSECTCETKCGEEDCKGLGSWAEYDACPSCREDSQTPPPALLN